MIEFPNTRWSVIARLADDPSGIGSLIELYSPAITRYLMLKFPMDQAHGLVDDIVQEVILDLIERPELLGDAKQGSGSRFRYVLMNSAYLLARNAKRRLIRASHSEHSEGDTLLDQVAGKPGPDVAAAMDRVWAESILEAAWQELAAWADEGLVEAEVPALLREHIDAGATLRDLSGRYGLSLATCCRRVARGRSLLQKSILDRLVRAGEVPANADPVAAYVRLISALA